MDVTQRSLSGVFASRYTIDGALGTGATSTVYRARDLRTDRPVAIKVLRKELAEALGPERFLREIKLTYSLHHPHILPLLDSGEYEGRLYFVAPYMDGGTLRQRLTVESQLPLTDAIRIACTIADALSYAHSQGFVHRDVKPENILFADGDVCLADFGIARAIERSTEDVTTSTGIARGTPAYMSPEQASGARYYDGRSDVYSLGCVLYEMIAGMRPFVAATTQAVISQRFMHSPRPLTVYRPNAPDQLEQVVSRALQLEAADRFRTAAEFAEALRAIPEAELQRAKPQRSRGPFFASGRRRALAIAAVVSVVALTVALTSRRLTSSRITPVKADTTRLVLFPVEGDSPRGASWHDDDLMHQAVARWTGVNVVDEFQVADALHRSGPVQSSEQAEAIARRLGAGRYVRGRVTRSGDNRHVYFALYEVGSEAALYTTEASLPTGLADATGTYQRLADVLLLRGARGDATASIKSTAHSLPAVQAFGRGEAALDNWNLELADSAFQDATEFDGTYARANFWLAQVRAWQNRPPHEWKIPAERALNQSEQLTERERDLSAALVFLSSARYDEACSVYKKVRDKNPRDFTPWFGLGQCNMMDNRVVRDAASPSKFRFHGSVARGVDAYAKAFEILPLVHSSYEHGAFEELRRILFLSQTIFPGVDPQEKEVFWGRPGLIGDSIVMIAYPRDKLFAGDPSTIPPGFRDALQQRLNAFSRIAAAWSAAYPRRSGARHAVAVSQEMLGDPSAINTLRAARSLETDPGRQRVLAAEEVIFLVKFGVPDDLAMLTRAKLLADSLLAQASPINRNEAEFLAPVAVLSGDCSKVDALVRSATDPDGIPGIPARVQEDAYVVTTRLVMDCPIDGGSLATLSAEVEAAVRRMPDDHGSSEQRLLQRLVVLAPRLNSKLTQHLGSIARHDLVQAAAAIARNELDSAKASLTAADLRVSPGVPTPDITLARARMWLDVRDTTKAIHILDLLLEKSRSITAEDLRDPVNAAALVSMMRLRSDLAARQSDMRNAQRWRAAAKPFSSSPGSASSEH